MRIEDYVKENREVINDLRIASALLEKRRPIIAESLMDLAERLDDLAESEDERIRKWIANYIHRGVFDEEEHPKALKAIEYLEKQKEQKPAEWSEEDEEMLNSCISSIEESKENRYAYKETDGDTSYDREVDWLESLRNRVGKESLQSWKPSEEQMDVFDTAAFQKGVQEGRRLEKEDAEHLRDATKKISEDLALTINDIEKLHTFLYAVKNNKQGAFTFTRLSDEQYKEVLRRFNKTKEQ